MDGWMDGLTGNTPDILRLPNKGYEQVVEVIAMINNANRKTDKHSWPDKDSRRLNDNNDNKEAKCQVIHDAMLQF
eukprot:scaffold178945_cov18-Prasinocladus_malaysianus.AAC.1